VQGVVGRHALSEAGRRPWWRRGWRSPALAGASHGYTCLGVVALVRLLMLAELGAESADMRWGRR
jgi:hypothetical protein